MKRETYEVIRAENDAIYAEHGWAWESVEALDAENAAELWAESDDSTSADYQIVSGSPAVVLVRDPKGLVTRWTVEGEPVPTYSATEVTS